MAYLEARMMDIDQVIRRWLAGESIRAVARSTGLDRNTVRRLIRFSEQAGVKPGDSWPDADKLQKICARMGQPGAAREPNRAGTAGSTISDRELVERPVDSYKSPRTTRARGAGG